MDKKDEAIKLLLVDDEAEFLAATAPALKRRGFDVTAIQDPGLVLKAIENELFDVIVLDVKMPGISGDDLFREIKQNLLKIPVIMLTGHGNVQHAFDATKEGVYEYLTKPCAVEKLAAVARAAVSDPGHDHTDEMPEENWPAIRLLFVDDEKDLLKSMATSLDRRGMEVSIADSEVEARKQLDRQLFAVALVDVKLRGGDGIELLHYIKRAQPLCEVILYTGHPSTDIAVEGVKAGAFDYLTKPMDAEEIAKKVRAAYRAHRNNAEQDRRRKVGAILEDSENY